MTGGSGGGIFFLRYDHFLCKKNYNIVDEYKKQCLNWNSFRVGALIYITEIKLVIKKDGLNM